MVLGARVWAILWTLAALATGEWAAAQSQPREGAEFVLPPPSAIAAQQRILPINLGSALQLAGVRPLDIDIAVQRLQAAAADLDRTKTLWLPNLYVGVDYFRHDGQIQDVTGNVFGISKSTLMAGGAPIAGTHSTHRKSRYNQWC